MSLSLSFACPPYDRILPLAYGRVAAQGIRLNYLSLEVEEVFWRQLRNQEFDLLWVLVKNEDLVLSREKFLNLA